MLLAMAKFRSWYSKYVQYFAVVHSARIYTSRLQTMWLLAANLRKAVIASVPQRKWPQPPWQEPRLMNLLKQASASWRRIGRPGISLLTKPAIMHHAPCTGAELCILFQSPVLVLPWCHNPQIEAAQYLPKALQQNKCLALQKLSLHRLLKTWLWPLHTVASWCSRWNRLF